MLSGWDERHASFGARTHLIRKGLSKLKLCQVDYGGLRNALQRLLCEEGRVRCDEHVGEGLQDLKVAVPRLHALIQLHFTQIGKKQGPCSSALRRPGQSTFVPGAPSSVQVHSLLEEQCRASECHNQRVTGAEYNDKPEHIAVCA